MKDDVDEEFIWDCGEITGFFGVIRFDLHKFEAGERGG